LDADIEKTEIERVNLFHDFVKSRLNNLNEKEIFMEAERLEIVAKAPLILCELLLDANAIAQIKKNKRLFQRFTKDNPKAQKYVMGGLEKTIEAFKDALLPKVANIMKTIYDEDIVDEEVILEWGSKVSKKYVSKDLAEQIHLKAKPFLIWLKEAEEESSEEDDEEENIELHFDEGAKISKLEVRKEPPVKTEATKAEAKGEDDDDEDEENDIDIDDI
jgi:translation initiation factor 5